MCFNTQQTAGSYKMVLSTLLVLLCLQISVGYESGPPVQHNSKLCKNMFPEGHKVAAQQGENPFTFEPSQKCFAFGQDISIEISTSKDLINGLFIQARSGTFSTAVNSFGTFRSKKQKTSSYRCFNRDKSAFGHKGKIGATSLTVIWEAPDTGLYTDVSIGGTIALEKKEFWINVFTIIKFNSSCVQQPLGENSATSIGYHAVSALITGVCILLQNL